MSCVDDPKEIPNAVGFDCGELNMIFYFEMYLSLILSSSLYLHPPASTWTSVPGQILTPALVHIQP